MQDNSPSSKVDPNELTWVERLLSVLGQTSSYDFDYATGHAKTALSIPIGVLVLGGMSTFLILTFGQPFDSRAVIWGFELFQNGKQTYLYPGIATETGWMGTARGALEIALLLISFAIGYLILDRLVRDTDELPKIEVGLGWKIASWVGFFLILIVPSFLAVFATGKLTDIASRYAPSHPEPFERLPPKQEISLPGELFELDRTGSTVFHDTSVGEERIRRTGRYLENVGLLREDRISRVRMSANHRPTEADTIYQVEVPIAWRWRDSMGLKKVARMVAMDLSNFVADGPDKNLAMQLILVSKTASGQLFRDTTTVVTDTSEVQEYTLSSVDRCCMHHMSETE